MRELVVSLMWENIAKVNVMDKGWTRHMPIYVGPKIEQGGERGNLPCYLARVNLM